ncbi:MULTISPECIES: DUF3329 domain-containing protein [unclassified Mycobacterium]|uniref:DUF3329 domain-containing protein n=1 Tax=unclassified Mycobacterium TaxID=2642494 RepID=UPI0029C8F264|nr:MULTISPECIES: DUF3329 domain-containing protein [unclassified Mycobacterium]
MTSNGQAISAPTDSDESPADDGQPDTPDERIDAESDAESDSEDTAEPETDGAEDTPPARRRWTRWVARGAVVAVVIGSLAAAGVLGWKLNSERAVAEAGQQALAAAQQYAVILTTVDANKLDENFTAVLDGATGEFKDMYSQSSGDLRQLLIDNKANSQGKVVGAGIKSATKDKVEVMLFVDQAVTNQLNPQPRMDRSRLVMTMERVNGRWLASKVDLP